MLERRQFLLAAASLPWLSFSALANTASGPRYLGASANKSGHYYLQAVDANGAIAWQQRLPSRGHSFALSPDQRRLAVIARRPGDWLLLIDVQTGELLSKQQSAANRHFYGHGVFSKDGRFFYTPENDISSGQGKIGVRDAEQGFAPVQEFDAFGIGPHELALLDDDTTLVIAIGGIQTHPDTGRAKLNLDSMQASLLYLNRHNGERLQQLPVAAPWQQNSLRHLAVGQENQIVSVLQYQGSHREQPPLIALHRRGQTQLQMLSAPTEIQKRMKNYCGSVCFEASGQQFAVSSPRGNLLTFWDGSSARYLGHCEVADGCGLSRTERPGEFLISSGRGDLYRYDLAESRPQLLHAHQQNKIFWDNHLLFV